MNEPFYADNLVTLHHADLSKKLAWLEANVLVTDPPYGRGWTHGDTTTARGWVSNRHEGIANDRNSEARDAVLALWGRGPAVVFGNLMLAPPQGTRHVLVYAKGPNAGFTGAVGGYRRNAEAIYLLGRHGSGLGGRSSVLTPRWKFGGQLARTTGHPHTKPVSLMEELLLAAPPGTVANPFAGSGTTLVAAKLLGRRAIGIEVDKAYCHVAARRLTQNALFAGVGGPPW